MKDKSVNALREAAANKRQVTINKVKSTLSEMDKNKLPITFQSVSKMAGVSRNWLYTEMEIATFIRQSKGESTIIEDVAKLRKRLLKKENEISEIKNKNRLLQAENQKLKAQLERVYGRIYQMKDE